MSRPPASKVTRTQNITNAKPIIPIGLSKSFPYKPSLRLKMIDAVNITIIDIQIGRSCLDIPPIIPREDAPSIAPIIT